MVGLTVRSGGRTTFGEADDLTGVVACLVLTDLDRKPVTAEAHDKLDAAQAVKTRDYMIPPATFEARSSKLSLGPEAVEKFEADRDWPAPRPDNLWIVFLKSNSFAVVHTCACE